MYVKNFPAPQDIYFQKLSKYYNKTILFTSYLFLETFQLSYFNYYFKNIYLFSSVTSVFQ